MARATTTKPRSAARTKTAGMPRATAAKSSAASSGGKTASLKLVAASPAASKDELRARIEKLERANATLRSKNKNLRLAHVEASEQVDALTIKLEGLERRTERQVRRDGPKAVKSRAVGFSGRDAVKPLRQSHDEGEAAEA